MSNQALPDESVGRPAGVRKRLRRLVRFACLLGAVLCLWPLSNRDVILAFVPALSPLVAVASILTLKTIRPLMALGLVTGLAALIRHRWFCRWVCPMGLCLDGVSFLGRRLRRKSRRPASIGRWLFALTLGGAILGCPLFLWSDPLALFAGLFLLIEQHQLLAGGVSLLVVASLLILSLLWPHIWCRGLCPLGAFQDLLSAMTRFARSMLRSATDVPDHVPSGYPLARRTMLGLTLGAASAGILRLSGRAAAKPLRPPGAADELTFKWLCTRCGNCVRSCPYGIINRETGKYGVAGILTPVLAFDKDYCREDCVRCTQVCPSGALASVDLKNKPDVHIGLAQVDMSLCLLGEDRECSACRRWCPYGAIRYIFSETNYTLVPMIDVRKCNGCGACEAACPTSPHKAISIKNR